MGQIYAPSHIDENYIQWRLPSHMWSDGKYDEQEIHVNLYPDGEWTAHTEFEQNIQRDLDEDEVASVRVEFGLDEWIAANKRGATAGYSTFPSR